MNERIVKVSDQYSYEQMMGHLTELCRVYPFLQLSYIGESVMGKPIPAIQVGSGETSIHYNAAFHANEWITSLILMVFLEDYAYAVQAEQRIFQQSSTRIFNRSTLFLVPMINPDGVNLVTQGIEESHPYYNQLMEWNDGSSNYTQWKSNIRGVDLNDQFPAHWEVEKDRRSPEGPGPRDYPGSKPLSEPEAIAISEYTKRQNFDLALALHTQGGEIYWNYRDYEPKQAGRMAEQLARVSGYEAVKLADSDAGYKDWFIQEYRKPGFTIEAGFGCNPLPIGQFREMYRAVGPLLALGLRLT